MHARGTRAAPGGRTGRRLTARELEADVEEGEQEDGDVLERVEVRALGAVEDVLRARRVGRDLLRGARRVGVRDLGRLARLADEQACRRDGEEGHGLSVRCCRLSRRVVGKRRTLPDEEDRDRRGGSQDGVVVGREGREEERGDGHGETGVGLEPS